MINENDILKVKKQLLPTGRAFKIPVDGVAEKLLLGLAAQEVEAYNSATGLLNEIIPDNNYFDVEICRKWEQVLGISSNELDSLSNRKAAIYRKMAFPANTLGRQHKSYLEGQLKAANFDCKVFEYADVKDYFSSTMHSLNIRHSFSTKHGGFKIPSYTGIIANYLNNEDEPTLSLSLEILKSIFWITGDTFDDFVNIPPYRMEEFRHIVLTIKPLHTVCLLRTQNIDDWILASSTWNNSGYWYNSGLWKY